MSHIVNVTVGDTQYLRQIRLRLNEEIDSRDDEIQIKPWVDTLDYILHQTEADVGSSPAEDACRDTYAILDELLSELIASSCEPAGDKRVGRDEVRRLYDDIDAVERVKVLVKEIVDPC